MLGENICWVPLTEGQTTAKYCLTGDTVSEICKFGDCHQID